MSLLPRQQSAKRWPHVEERWRVGVTGGNVTQGNYSEHTWLSHIYVSVRKEMLILPLVFCHCGQLWFTSPLQKRSETREEEIKGREGGRDSEGHKTEEKR